jgi:hypothetical protein
LRDVPLRRKLTERGRDYAGKTHSKERLIAAILRLYRELPPRGAAEQSPT